MNTLVGEVQAPFTRGGAEALVEGLLENLDRAGHRTDVLRIPLRMLPRAEIVKNCLLWRLLDLEVSYGQPVDLFIPTKFPSYLVRHPRKVPWLFHQVREVYELYGTTYSGWTGLDVDATVRDSIRALDRVGLGEARTIFTISQVVADRLRATTGFEAECLYHPPPLAGRTRSEPAEDFVFSVGRLDRTKRLDLLLEAMARVRSPVRAVIAGDGPEREALRRRAGELELGSRVSFVGRIPDEEVIDLYARCLAVYFAPFDEDYGYVTLEGFLSGKPVIAAEDSGGVLEFVEDGATGRVVRADGEEVADAIDALHDDRVGARALGAEGRDRVRPIRWDTVIERLTSAG